MTNVPKLKAEINETAARLKAIKKVYREPHQPNVTWATVKDYIPLKRRATILCSLRAHLRGKIHLRGSTTEQQLELVKTAWEEYRLGTSQEEAA